MTTLMDDKKKAIKEPSPRPARVLAGLAWAEGGNPFFYCLVAEKRDRKEESFETPEPVLEILDEGEIKNFSELATTFETLPQLHCNVIYAIIEPKHMTFIRNFNVWKRKEKINLALKQTKSSSLESSLLKIKELIGEKRLMFPTDSIIKSQLTIFSKSNLKDTADFYAVRALTMVIDAFGKEKIEEKEEAPNMKGWW